MGLFDNDPKFQKLSKLRDSGYKGWVDQDGNATTKAAWEKKHGVPPGKKK